MVDESYIILNKMAPLTRSQSESERALVAAEIEEAANTLLLLTRNMYEKCSS